MLVYAGEDGDDGITDTHGHGTWEYYGWWPLLINLIGR